jgi:hypothetical protein
VILANQTIADLKTKDVDIVSTVRANTRLKQVFAASDLVEQDELVRGSGETLVYNRSFSEYLGVAGGPGGAYSRSSSETVSPRLRPNDILLASDHPEQSIVQIRRGAGYAQYGGMPFVMTSTFHIEKEEYNDRKNASWPAETDETITPRLRFPDPPPVLPVKELPPDKRDPQKALIQDRATTSDTGDSAPDPVTAPNASPSEQVSSPPSHDSKPEVETSDDTPSGRPFQAIEEHWQEQRQKHDTDLRERIERRKQKKKDRSKKRSSQGDQP